MIQIYTGNGKGKTTAAIGLAIRAVGAGKKVYFCQFIKGKTYSELTTLRRIRGITLHQFGRGCFIRTKPQAKDIACARGGLARLLKIVSSGKFGMVICDEIIIAVSLGLLTAADVLNLIRNTPPATELVLTGRYAPKALIAAADLVSEVKEVKHYYRRGVKARKGIEC